VNETAAENVQMTHRRKVILDELIKDHSHPTADEIFHRVRKKLPRVSMGTVYRNLELLSKNGLIRTIESGSSRRYDADLHDHYHVRCVICGKIDDAPIEPNPELLLQMAEATDYDLTGHNVEFFGVCPSCKRNDDFKHQDNQEEQDNG
jgi:Fur family transcriptional regulator, peroxide stress response regulator